MKTLVQFIAELQEAAKREGKGGTAVIMADESEPTVEWDEEFGEWVIS